jgi:hypothetical protein
MYKITLIIIAAVAFFASCTKDSSGLLDPATSVLDDKQVFASATYADQYLNDIYGWLLPVYATTGNNGTRWRGTDALLETTTDNGSSNLSSTGAFRTFNTGAWTAASTSMFFNADWQQSYQAIRACNLYLKNIDNVPEDPEYGFKDSVRTVRKAEAVFLKAWFYAELCKEFGGVPLIDVILPPKDTIIPRNTYDETVDYIVRMCDQASTVLPEHYPDYQLGRVTKGAALALKARTLLYAASPLWNNPNKQSDSPYRGKYDLNKWKVAAQACKDFLDYNSGNRLYNLNTDISTMFTIIGENKEWIFEHRMRPQAYMTYISIPTKMWSANGPTKNGCNQVTYNMVKQYEIIKGGKAYSIDDPASGYNANDPYKNRDPRFYRDCMFNGCNYQGRAGVFGEQENGSTVTLKNPTEVSPYYTYIFSIKFADLTLTASGADGRNPTAVSTSGANYPYIRLAEIYLDYAEAMNEAYGPENDALGAGLTALQALNLVRQRAAYQNKKEYLGYTGSMPPVESGLTKEQMRAKIHHERRVELTFEEHRFWDCRRWKEAPDEDILAQIPTWKVDGTVQYRIVTLENRPWFPQMFRMPIPEGETFVNPGLKQNPGYNRSDDTED